MLNKISRMASSSAGKKSTTKHDYKRYFIALLIILVIIGSFGYQFSVHRVFFHSMENTLFPGDYLLVRRKSSWMSNLKGDDDKFQFHNKIFVFKDKYERLLVKRCIGVSGDTMRFTNENEVYINGILLEYNGQEVFELEALSQSIDDLFTLCMDKNIQVIDSGSSHLSVKATYEEIKLLQKSNLIIEYSYKCFWQKPNSLLDTSIKIYIPQKGDTFNGNNGFDYGEYYHSHEGSMNQFILNNYLFMIGDNRPVSIDSRMFGIIPESHIVGEVILVIRSNSRNSVNIGKQKYPRFITKPL